MRVYGGNAGRTIVFVETKKEADELAVHPELTKKVGVKALHGDIPQATRESTLAAFKAGNVRCIVATDVAARGLDIKGVDLVIQTQPPCGRMSGRADGDTYVHRSGRTGRAGAKGTAIMLFTRQQEPLVAALERATRNTFVRVGAPQPEDLVRASAGEAREKMAAVAEEQVEFFLATAREAVEEEVEASGGGESGSSSSKAREKAATVLLARALAVVSGYTQPVHTRSLLNSSEDQCTWCYTLSENSPLNKLTSSSPVWAALRLELPGPVVEEVKGMTLWADGKGAVFDLPAKHSGVVGKAAEKETSCISRAVSLPELAASAPAQGGGGAA